jgi:hypothetical protein
MMTDFRNEIDLWPIWLSFAHMQFHDGHQFLLSLFVSHHRVRHRDSFEAGQSAGPLPRRRTRAPCKGRPCFRPIVVAGVGRTCDRMTGDRGENQCPCHQMTERDLVARKLSLTGVIARDVGSYFMQNHYKCAELKRVDSVGA